MMPGMYPRGRSTDIYLTPAEFVAYGIVERADGLPKVTVADVVKVINDLRLDAHGVRDGQPCFDPIPIRLALGGNQ